MTRPSVAIARAEYQVLTSFMRSRRTLYMTLIVALSLVWATVVAPILMETAINAFMSMDAIRGLLMVMFPGVMRSLMMLIWLALFLFPLSQALQEIKIGQWEIFLSNNVRTKDILAGTFMGKIPLYGVVVILLAPLVISPFMLAFQVSILGQILVYGVFALLALSAIWVSNLVTSVIQARLGDSARGNDIAKAISMIVAIVVVVPMYGLMFFLPAISEMMGANVLLALPSTWFADIVTWISALFNGVSLTPVEIGNFAGILQMDLWMSAILMGAWVAGTIALGLWSADRVFTIDAGLRTEVVTTTGRENVFIRGIRRASPGPFGTLMVTTFKDFMRKAQNLSKIGYGTVLAVMLPIIMTSIDIEYVEVRELFFMLVVMMSLVGTFPFAGTGFLESKDQLWIIQGAPDGAKRFVRSRIASQLIMVVPLVAIPTVFLIFVLEMTLVEFLLVFFCGYLAAAGGMLIATGITASNPNYEDTKSPAHQANIMTSVMLAEFSIIGVLMGDLLLSVLLDIDLFGFIGSLFGPANIMFGMTMMGLGVQWILGLILVWRGTRSLSRPDP